MPKKKGRKKRKVLRTYELWWEPTRGEGEYLGKIAAKNARSAKLKITRTIKAIPKKYP